MQHECLKVYTIWLMNTVKYTVVSHSQTIYHIKKGKKLSGYVSQTIHTAVYMEAVKTVPYYS